MHIAVLTVAVASLFALMAVRALRSGTTVDRMLCAALSVGLILLLMAPFPLPAYWLIACAIAYLVSQVVTGARVVSRGLPVLAGLLMGLLWWVYGAGWY